MNSEPVQAPLDFPAEDIYDALSIVVRALGGAKKVGGEMFPHLPIEDAKNRVNDCLNRARRGVFSPEQLLYLLRRGKEAGCHVAKHFIDDDAGYDRSKPIDPRDKAAQLQRDFIEHVKRGEQLFHDMRAAGVLPK